MCILYVCAYEYVWSEYDTYTITIGIFYCNNYVLTTIIYNLCYKLYNLYIGICEKNFFTISWQQNENNFFVHV